MAVAAVHGHCTARVLDRAIFPVRDDEAACGRAPLEARPLRALTARPEPSVDKTRPRRRSGYPGRGRGQKHPVRQVAKRVVLVHGPCSETSLMPPSSGGLFPRTETHRTHSTGRVTFSYPDLSGAWPANRRAVDGHHRSPEVNHRLAADDGAPDNTATLPVRCDVATWSGGAWGRNLLRG